MDCHRVQRKARVKQKRPWRSTEARGDLPRFLRIPRAGGPGRAYLTPVCREYVSLEGEFGRLHPNHGGHLSGNTSLIQAHVACNP